MSPLLPGTIAFLRAVRAFSGSMFSNSTQAEAFEARWRRLPFYALRRTDGKIALCDVRLPMGARTVVVCGDDTIREEFDRFCAVPANKTKGGAT